MMSKTGINFTKNIFILSLLFLCECKLNYLSTNCRIPDIEDSLIHLIRVDSFTKHRFNIAPDNYISEVNLSKNEILKIERTIFKYICNDTFFKDSPLVLEFGRYHRQYFKLSNNLNSNIFIYYTLIPLGYRFPLKNETWNDQVLQISGKIYNQYQVTVLAKGFKIIEIREFD